MNEQHRIFSVTMEEIVMKIIKRNGAEVVFDREKITAAIRKANDATEKQKELSEDKLNTLLMLLKTTVAR